MSENSFCVPMTDISLSGEKIILVGGMGFIGHHLAMSLKSVGAQVMIVDHLPGQRSSLSFHTIL